MEAGFSLEDIFTLVIGHLVPAVHEVDEEAGSSGSLAGLNRFGYKGEVLTQWTEWSRKLRLPHTTSPNCPSGRRPLANVPAYIRVMIELTRRRQIVPMPMGRSLSGLWIGILMKGEEVTKGQVLSEFRRNLIVEDQGDKLDECMARHLNLLDWSGEDGPKNALMVSVKSQKGP
jgi:hypothetical protein